MTKTKNARHLKGKSDNGVTVSLKEFEEEFMAIYIKYVDQFRQDSRSIINQVLNNFKTKMKDLADNHEITYLKRLNDSIKTMNKFTDRIKDLEETFYILYGNIKRNHFLYVDQPSEWWDKHHPIIKEDLEKQNKEIPVLIKKLYKLEKKNEKAS